MAIEKENKNKGEVSWMPLANKKIQTQKPEITVARPTNPNRPSKAKNEMSMTITRG